MRDIRGEPECDNRRQSHAFRHGRALDWGDTVRLRPMGRDSLWLKITKAIVESITGRIASIEDTDKETNVVTVGTGRQSPQTTQRDAARSQMLWMVGQASRAAKSGRVDDARWWRDRAVCALWNMS